MSTRHVALAGLGDSRTLQWLSENVGKTHGKTTKNLMDELDGSPKISENVGETQKNTTFNE